MNGARRLLPLGLVAAGLLVLGCSSAGSPIVGQWHCTNPTNPAGDSVADGTVTVTTTNNQSFSGTWTASGSTYTVHGLGPGGTEDWTMANDRLTSNQTGQVCTRA
jgi:hypothetical protein